MKGNLKIHSQNILPIIKKWLYSEKDIFVRELVSNACDAIRKIKILSDQGVIAPLSSDTFKIDITIDKNKKTLTFADTGIGMDAEEVEKYIAQIAFSGAEEFVSKYSSNQEKDQIIGHFGLGFYSAFMVAEKVEIDSLSYKEGAKPVLWSSDGTAEYELSDGTRTQRGTTITLFVSQEHEEYLEEAKLKELLQYYCSFLPYPITLNGNSLENKEPLWNKPALDCTEQEYRDFYRKLYPFDEEPLFWVHLNVDYPFHLKGILYFPKLRPGYDYKKCQIKLYCNRVFVSDNCQDLIPEYLLVLKGAIDSPDIPLNVSRSYLQMDRTVRQLAAHISKKVSDRLALLPKEEFEKAWPTIEIIIKLGCLQDEKFYERIKDLLIWKNEAGAWTTLAAYKERHPGKPIFYTTQNSHFLDLYRKQSLEVLFMDSFIDTPLMSFLESKDSSLKFQRIDGALNDHLLSNNASEKAQELADYFKEKLPGLAIEAKSLASDALPALLILDEETRRMRDYMALQAPDLKAFTPKQTLVINTNNKLIQSIPGLAQKDPALASDLAQHILDLTLLSQKELPLDTLSTFITRSSSLLERLASF